MIKIFWSERKNRQNIKKHKVDFSEAKTIFDDPLQISKNDPDHSFDENRFITMGVSAQNRLLIMAHTFDSDKIRIITARKPTKSERKTMKKENSMRKEYDMSDGVRGKFFGKVDTKNSIIEADEKVLDEVFEEELAFLESNLARIKSLKSRLPELDDVTRQKISQRISNASEILDEIALSK